MSATVSIRIPRTKWSIDDFSGDGSIDMEISNERFHLVAKGMRSAAMILKKSVMTWNDGSGNFATDGCKLRNLSSETYENLKSHFTGFLDGAGTLRDLRLKQSAGANLAGAPQSKSSNSNGHGHSHNNGHSHSNGHSSTGRISGSKSAAATRPSPNDNPPPSASLSILKQLSHSSEIKPTSDSSKSGVLPGGLNALPHSISIQGFADPKPVPVRSAPAKPLSANALALIKSADAAKNVAKMAQRSSSGLGSGSGSGTAAPRPTVRTQTHTILQQLNQHKPAAPLDNTGYRRVPPSSNWRNSHGSSSSTSGSGSGSGSLWPAPSSSSISSGGTGNRFTGMRNLGNTCYMGAVAQALLALPSLTEDLQSPFWKEGAKESVSITKDVEKRRKAPTCIHELVELVFKRRENMSRHQSTDLAALKRAIDRHSSQFQGYSQQDAHEFLCALIDAVHDEGVAVLKAISAQLPAVATPPSTSTARTSLDSRESEDDVDVVALDVGGDDDDEDGGKDGRDAGVNETEVMAMIVDGGPDPTPDGGGEDSSNKRQRLSEGQFHARSVPTPITPTTTTSAALTPGPASVADQLPPLLPTLRSLHAAVRVTLTCQTCNTPSDPRTDFYRDFSLDLDRDEYASPAFRRQHALDDSYSRAGGIPLELLVENFFAAEQRSLSCTRCNDGGALALATSALTVLPAVLVLHLKRFRYDPRSNSFSKVNTKVAFPLSLELPAAAVDPGCEGPDMSGSSKLRQAPAELVERWERLASESAQSQKSPASLPKLLRYSLVAVVRHRGQTASSGHYVCDIREKERDSQGAYKWTHCDDSSMCPTTAADVLADKLTPYLLFYALDTN